MNVNVMRVAFRSLLTATNNVHKCASSGRSYSKKGIANKFCLLCFVAVNGSMRSMVCLSWLLCYNKLVSSAEEKFNYWKADYAAIRAKFSSIDWFMEFDDKSVNDTWNQFSHIIADAVKEFVPLYKHSDRERKPPWISSETRKLIRKRRKAWSLYTVTRSAKSFVAYKKNSKYSG